MANKNKNFKDEVNTRESGSNAKGKNKKRDLMNRKSAANGSVNGNESVLTDASKRNDFSWYNKYPELLNDATRVSFFNQLGAQLNINEGYHNRIPGVCVFDLVCTPGTSLDVNSALSRAAVQLYESVRKNLSKPTTDYESQDLAIMLACIADLHAQAANITRLFGIIGRWQSDNLYTPRSIIREIYGMSYNTYNNIIAALPSYRERFNQLINYANWLEIPVGIDIVNRWSWPFEGIYKDSDTTKGQVYAFSKSNVFTWDETGATGSRALSTPLLGGSIGGLLDTFENCISALYNSTAVRIMQSDLRRAYQTVNSMTFLPVPVDYRLDDPKKLDVVLSQIENLNFCRPISSDVLRNEFIPSFTITQDPMDQVVYCDPKWIVDTEDGEEVLNANFISNRPYLLNLHWDNPNTEDITEATRLMTCCTKYTELIDDEEVTFVGVKASSHVCVGMHICINPDETDVSKFRISYVTQNGFTGSSALSLGSITQFDWAPFLYLWADGETNGSFIGDTDNYTILDEDVVKRIHDICSLSLWKCPDVTTLK